MAMLTPPPVTDYELLPSDVYEAVCVDVEEVPNNFYNPDEDSPNKATQFLWKFRIVEDGKGNGAEMKHWTSANLSRSAKSKLMPIINILDKSFDIDKGYASMDDFRDRVIGKGIRLVLGEKKGKPKDDGTTPTYNKIESVMPSKRKEQTVEEIAAALGLAQDAYGASVPF